MRKFFSVQLAIFAVVSATSTFAQAKKDDFTSTEVRQIDAFSRRFERRLNQTKDIRPLLSEFFVKDFVERNLKNKYFMFFDSDLVRTKRPGELKRFYVGSINWLFLVTLAYDERAQSINTSSDDGVEAYLARLPRAVSEDFRRHHDVYDLLERFMSLVESDAPHAQLTTERYFHELLPIFERSAPILRAYVIRNKTDKTKEWKRQMEEAGEYLHAYEARKYVCSDDCYGFVKGTKITYVNIPLFQLVLTKVGTQYRVLDFKYYVD